MPSLEIIDDGAIPTRPKKATTPRRSPAVRRPANATPTKKVAANKAGTPNSAPVRAKPSSKKAEPTLFGDFLLGRPSTNRPRRKSLDVVPTEMKRSAVGRVQPPGGVKERVKLWQKASAVAAVEDVLEPPNEPDDISLHLDGASVTERDRRRIKFRKHHTHKPGRRKNEDDDDSDDPPAPVKSVSSPRKRVVSDDHWVQSKAKASLPRTPKVVEEPISKGQTIPKNFLKNSINPPFEKKIEDWNKRTIGDDEERYDKQSRTVPKPVSKERENGILPSRVLSPDREIRVRPPKEKSDTDAAIAKPMRMQEKRKERQSDVEDFKGIRRKSEKKGDPSPVIRKSPKNRSPSAGATDAEEEELNDSYRTPTRPQRIKSRQRKSVSPESLADIPVGYSAFSVLGLSVGGEYTTTRPLKPQRQPSLSAVPKALKKVYTEGMKKVHDAVDPPRTGVNQPPSIESWLKGTSDPFVDDVRTTTSEHNFEVEKPKSRQRKDEKETVYQRHSSSESDGHGTGTKEVLGKGMQTFPNSIGDTVGTRPADKPPLGGRSPGERIVGEGASLSLSPTGLKRSPAARHVSSPKTAKHAPPVDMVIDSFAERPQPVPQGRPDTKASEPKLGARKSTAEGARRNLQGHLSDSHCDKQEPPSQRSPETLDASYQNSRDVPSTNSRISSDQRDCTTTGQRCLSTIASVETFQTSSSLTETSSGLSDTTVTQTTVTQNTSRTSNTSNASSKGNKTSSQPKSNLGLKRRLTKHSDLLSVLSLQDTSGLDKTKGIRSACSIRTNRTHLGTATITDLLRELADDEVKYMRELKTLVDGVIPVLLSCVLSKSNLAVGASLFGQNHGGETDALITKPIVDMGVALEQLKSFHKRIPLHDSELLIHWASGAHKVYEDYITAWRMGFQHVIVNLAPAAGSNPAEEQSPDEMPRNEDGDVLNENGERVDVAFLLKRPLVRVKYLARVLKGIHSIKPRDQAAKVNAQYEELLTKIRRRTREEEARLEDQAASSTDTTRARDPRTLAPQEGVTIDPSRQVYAKDFFDFGLSHSTGQRIDCRVELLFRDKPQDKSDAGDVLICEVDSISRWLLFPPVELDRISAGASNSKGEIVVMIRGTESSNLWHEVFTLRASDDETAAEWIQMLGLSPSPLNLGHINTLSVPILPSPHQIGPSDRYSNGSSSLRSPVLLASGEMDVPIGERHRKHEQPRLLKTHNDERKEFIAESSPLPARYSSREKAIETGVPEDKPRDLNDAMERAGRVASSDLKRTKAKRYHSLEVPKVPMMPLSEGSAKSNESDAQNGLKSATPPTFSSGVSEPPLAELPCTPKLRKTFQRSADEDYTSPLKSSINPNDSYEASYLLSPSIQDLVKNNEAPPPPPHGTASPNLLKPSPVLVKPSSTKNRRTSSPLKHEYQPSTTPDVSSASDDSDPEDFEESSDSSEEELEAVDLATPLPDSTRPRSKASPPGSSYSLPSASLAPSNSASQAPYDRTRSESDIKTTKVVAAISCWSDKGRWVDLHPHDCSIVIGPGLIEAYARSGCLASGTAGNNVLSSGCSSVVSTDKDSGATRPLVSLELTPIVPLRQSNALDIEIRSPPTAKSSIECTHTIRFRSRTLQECNVLYAAIHKARLENPVYMKLEQERIVNAYGKQLLEESAGSNRRKSWFGRSKSYRASTRAPSDAVSENSSNSIATAISRLRGMGIMGAFNIDKSSVGMSQGGPSGTSSGATSVYTGSTDSGSSGITPPRSPGSPSTAMTGTSNAVSFGSSDLQVRLYLNVTPSKWSDIGNALLTVTHPPRGMRQASSLYHGVEKRIIVTRKRDTKQTLNKRLQGSGSPKNEVPGAAQVILDVVLGGACFSRLGVVGVVMNVWEDIKGDNGEVGKAAAIGGVSGRTRRWLFHFGSAAETAWAFSLVGGGVR